jgi:hypothetical protein
LLKQRKKFGARGSFQGFNSYLINFSYLVLAQHG